MYNPYWPFPIPYCLCPCLCPFIHSWARPWTWTHTPIPFGFSAEATQGQTSNKSRITSIWGSHRAINNCSIGIRNVSLMIGDRNYGQEAMGNRQYE